MYRSHKIVPQNFILLKFDARNSQNIDNLINLKINKYISWKNISFLWNLKLEYFVFKYGKIPKIKTI